MPTEDDYTLQQLNPAIRAATEAHWLDTLDGMDDRVSRTRYESILRDSGTANTNPAINIHALKPQSDVADALLRVSRVKKGRDAPRIKVLDIYLHPRLDLDSVDNHSTAFMEEFWLVNRLAIQLPIQLIFGENPADSIKMYGRDDYMRGYFELISTEIAQNGGIHGLSVTSHGKWLEFRKNGESL